MAILLEKFHILFHRKLLSLRIQNRSSKNSKLTNHVTICFMFWLAPMHDQYLDTKPSQKWCDLFILAPTCDMIPQPSGTGSSGFSGNSPHPPGCQTHAEEQVCSQPPPSTLHVCLSTRPWQLSCWSPGNSVAPPASAAGRASLMAVTVVLLPSRVFTKMGQDAIDCFLSTHPRWERSGPRATDQPREEASCVVTFTSHHWWQKLSC